MLLPQPIGPYQTSFVLGRHIIENIVVAEEVIQSMCRKTGKRGFMVIKVDLEKLTIGLVRILFTGQTESWDASLRPE